MSEIFAVQLTAVATLALAVLALVTAVLAYLAWRKQSKEVSDQAKMLCLQDAELTQVSAERKREALERRRAQAVQVYIWEAWEGHVFVSHIRNTSQQPIHYVQLEFWDAADNYAKPQTIAVNVRTNAPLMPGDEYVLAPEPPGTKIHRLTATFQDNAGVSWRIRQGAQPEQIPSAQPLSPREPAADDGPPTVEAVPDMGQ